MKIDYQVIRGLAYYTGVVFEAFDRKGEFRAIAGGGRYNNLVKLISGGKVDLPALGFGMGDVVLLELLKERGLLPKFDSPMDVYVLIEDEAMRPAFIEARPRFAGGRLCGGISAHAAEVGQAIQARAGIESGSHRAAGKRRLRPHPQFENARGNRHRHRRRGESSGVKLGALMRPFDDSRPTLFKFADE